MKTLSQSPIAVEYSEAMGEECQLGKYVVTVSSYTNDSRSGSWERGFKFSSNTYGYLARKLKPRGYHVPRRYSPDHGATWYESFDEMKKHRTGKVKLNSRKSKEFAFDAIQKINKDYDPGYVWH